MIEPSPERTIAYFSMEIALESRMPTYSGGLGVLAGDAILAAADLKVPMVAVTLLHRKGYFDQRLGPDGSQQEVPVEWDVARFLRELPERVTVTIEGRTVHLRAWLSEVAGATGFTVPVYFLDADLADNTEADRTFTHVLYGGDARYRLCQEVILGLGGVRMLRAIGYRKILRFHMNEGHASLLTFALLEEEAQKAGRTTVVPEDLEVVRQQCVFTTHTPAPPGHDQFPMELVRSVLGPSPLDALEANVCCNGVLNLTFLALTGSHYVNGVAKKHGEVSQSMFASAVDAITNGVQATRWTAEPFQVLFDAYIPGWRQDNFMLRNAVSLPADNLWKAHLEAKRQFLEAVKQRTGLDLAPEVLTLGFGRRAAAYKRADLLFRDVERLSRLVATVGSLQIVYAGKAHAHDEGGKALIRRVVQAAEQLQGTITVVYLENYDMELARLMTAGSDVWLNTPQPPLEASGTSGMKAALNGVPSLSILDGWWIEGHIEGVTGWAIGAPSGREEPSQEQQSDRDALSLYEKLEDVVVPMFYEDRARWLEIMRHAIALNGSFFHAHRMVQQYVLRAYFT